MTARRAESPAIGRRIIDPASILDAMADATLVVDGAGIVRYVNAAAEQFFALGVGHMVDQALGALLPGDHPVHHVVTQVREGGGTLVENDVILENPRMGSRLATLHVSVVPEAPGAVLLVLREQSIARRLDQRLTHRGAARSIAGMAAMLGHEVKNPLSGIRGAAQLLEQGASDADKVLTRLICEETERIRTLVDRMEAFSDERPITREPVNVHEVLDRVRRLAESGFARGLRIVESYDPSIPPVLGNRDMLIQVFLNLVKNAAEAVSPQGGEIMLSSAFQPGVRMAVAGSDARVHLPIAVAITDNGTGVPEAVRAHLFEAFVSTKPKGRGLGLALVAKLVADHGGLVELDTQPRRTCFRVMLPKAEAT
jgi:two-component system nitrogen regulation sensor histidine kinase GlnL